MKIIFEKKYLLFKIYISKVYKEKLIQNFFFQLADIACYGKPYDEQTLENMKRKRLQELRVKSILVELLLYVCFLTILYFISYNNRDFNSFHITRHLNNQLLQSPTRNSSFHTLRYSNVTTNSSKSYGIFRIVSIFNEIDIIVPLSARYGVLNIFTTG